MTEDARARPPGRDGRDRAVSPVVGTILMVGIGTVLAATVGTLALGLGDAPGDTAQVTVAFEPYDDDADDDPDAIRVTHRAGDAVPADRIEVRVDDDAFRWTGGAAAGDTFVVADAGGAAGIAADATLSSGDVSGERVTVVTLGPAGDEGTLVDSYDVDE